MNSNLSAVPATNVLTTSVDQTRKWTQTQQASGFLILLCTLSVLLTGCQQPRSNWADGSVSDPGPSQVGGLSAALTPAPAVSASPATQLREGDVIQVAFGAETNLNTLAKIQLDGSVVLPLLGRVDAAGKTLQDFQAELTKTYERYIKVSELTVTLAATTASVYVSGAVLRPGRILLDRPLTAMEAVMEAGGFDLTRAKLNAVSVLRMENGQQRRYRVDLKTALRDGDTHPFHLKPFDIVHVPEKTFNF